MDIKEAEMLGLELINISELAVVTTINKEGFPQSRAMFNLRNKTLFPNLAGCFADNFIIYFTTNTSSSKVEHLRSNNRASIYFCRPDDWRGLNLSGTIAVSNDPDLRKSLWQESWTMYYPGGYSDPDYSVLVFTPYSASYYHQLDYIKWQIEGAGK